MSKKRVSTVKGILAVLVTLCWLVCVYRRCGFYFETNDDRLITEILSGVVSLRADGRAVYLHYLLGAPLAILYHCFPGIPWYGLFLITMYGMAYCVLLSAIVRQCEKIEEYLAAGVITILFFMSTLQILSILQFTSTAAFVAVSGYTYLLLEGKSGKKKYVLFGAFELLAYLIRENAMLMIQPIGLLVWGGVELFKREYSLKQKMKKVLAVCLPLLLIVTGGVLVKKIAYGTSEWKEYMAFTKAEETLFDFYGKPDYTEVKDILNDYGVTETEYIAYTQYVILDDDISAECAGKLASYARNKYSRNSNCLDILGQIINEWFYADYHGLNTMVVLLWGVTIVWIIVQKSYPYLWALLGLKIGETAIWYFILWRGRVLWRVTAPLFLCEIFILSAIIWRVLCEKRIEKTWKYVVFAATLAMLLRFSWLTGQSQYRYAVQENKYNEIMRQSMYEIEEYCYRYPEKRFLLGANSMSYFRGGALDTWISLPRNSVVTGNWFSYSPPSREYLRHYFGGENQGVYLIVYSETPIDFAALDYLEEKTNCDPVEVDSFSTISGAVYTVYYFGEKG